MSTKSSTPLLLAEYVWVVLDYALGKPADKYACSTLTWPHSSRSRTHDARKPTSVHTLLGPIRQLVGFVGMLWQSQLLTLKLARGW
jgi:hypothetical protein